jgi:hypothetical protein
MSIYSLKYDVIYSALCVGFGVDELTTCDVFIIIKLNNIISFVIIKKFLSLYCNNGKRVQNASFISNDSFCCFLE